MEDNTIKLMEIRIAELEKLVKFQQTLMGWGADEINDIASAQAAADSMSEDAESYRKELEYAREDLRAAYAEIDTIKERNRELERAVISQSVEISQLRGMLRWEDDKKRVNAARKADWISSEDRNEF